MDIAAWLHDLGLSQYRDAFEKNAIDAEVLRELTAEDLKEMGVAPVATGASCSPRSPPCAPRQAQSRKLSPRPPRQEPLRWRSGGCSL